MIYLSKLVRTFQKLRYNPIITWLHEAVHAVLFLFICNEMFDGGNNSGALNPFNAESSTEGLQDRVVSEAFPVCTTVSPERELNLGELTSAASGLPTKWSYTGAKVDVDTLTTELFANGHSSAKDEVFVPCSANLESIRLELWAC
jgi:hypothetical protein